MGRRVVLVVMALWCCSQMALAAVVQGVVNGPDGKPVAGALVALSDPDSNSPWRLATTRSAADGRFTFDLPGREQLAECTLVATSDAGCGAALRGEAAQVTVEIKAWSTAAGRVVATGGKPVAGAEVALRLIGTGDDGNVASWPEEAPWPQLQTTTDADGRWTLARFPGSGGNVRVRHPDYAEAWSPVTAGDDGQGDPTELELAASLAGRVTGPDGKPVAGIAVMAFERGHVGIVDTARTGADGRYRITGLPEGALSVGLLDGSGAVVAMPRPKVRLKAGTTTEGVDFAGVPGQLLTVTVVDSASGRPVPNVAVTGGLEQGPLPEDPPLFTDAQGRLVLHALPGTAYLNARPVSPWLDLSEQVAEIQVEAGKAPAPVTLKIERGQIASGKLVDEAGAAVGRAAISVTVGEAAAFCHAETNEAGVFSIGPLPKSGALQITVTEDNGFERWDGRANAAELNPADWKLTVPVVARTTVAGRVVDAAGRPLAEATVTLSSLANANPNHPSITDQTATSDAEGKFSFERLPAALDYRALAAKEGYRYQRGGGQTTARVPTHLDDIVMQGLTGKVSGTVTDAAGKPVAEATVLAVGYTDRSATTDEAGRFTLSKLPPGPVRLVALSGRRAADLTSRTGEGNAALKLRAVRAPSEDEERDLAEDLLHAAWKDSAKIEWYDRTLVPGAMARFDPAAATAMLAELNAKDQTVADLLTAGLIDGLRVAPSAMLPALKLADGLPLARRAHLRLVAALMLLDGPESAQAAKLFETTPLPPGAGQLTQAARAVLAARLGQGDGIGQLKQALAGDVDEEALSMWAISLAWVAGGRADILAGLTAKLQPEQAVLVRLAGALGVSHSQPALAATLLREALAAEVLQTDDAPDLALGIVRTALARTLAALPAAEASALAAALPERFRAAAQLLNAARAEAGEVEQRVGAAIKAGPPWALLPLASSAAPRAARAWLDKRAADEEGDYGDEQAVLAARGLLDPMAARLEIEQAVSSEPESAVAAVPAPDHLVAMAQVDLVRARELAGAIADAADRCSAQLALARHLARAGRERWVASYAMTDSAEDFLRTVLLSTD
ncbi:MAG: carboxypeptidase regulatory-like domain-containing protein [Armatimonadetes bacterium]|nr:carboxypeptidase regulatory-like domain-containing protein [Armatimonadota bacterium]